MAQQKLNTTLWNNYTPIKVNFKNFFKKDLQDELSQILSSLQSMSLRLGTLIILPLVKQNGQASKGHISQEVLNMLLIFWFHKQGRLRLILFEVVGIVPIIIACNIHTGRVGDILVLIFHFSRSWKWPVLIALGCVSISKTACMGWSNGERRKKVEIDSVGKKKPKDVHLNVTVFPRNQEQVEAGWRPNTAACDAWSRRNGGGGRV